MSTGNPLVSIIMPVYNAATYLKESIDSVLRQDYDNYELIIINDGSSDGSPAIIDSYADRDPRIRAIHQDNMGLVATLNKGVSLASGQLIARIDGDDPWFDNKLSEQVEVFVRDSSIVLVGGGFEIIDQDGYFIETVATPIQDSDIRRTLMLRNPFGHAGVIYSKAAFDEAGGYSSDVGPTEDYDLWIRLAQLGKLENLARPIYRYRINRGGISQQNSKEQATQTKLHADRQWRKQAPLVMSRKDLLNRSDNYLASTPLQWYGIALKEQFLQDNAQIGVKLIRYGHYTQGLRQLFNVTSTGRTGIRAVVKRIRSVDSGSLSQTR